MKINRTNYEIWFIDYADGKLSVEEKKELFQFLNLHPDLKEEFEGFENLKLEEDSSVFENKESLKKSTLTITKKNCEEYFIAYHENLLSAADKKAVELFVNNYPDVKKDFDAFGKTYLTAGKNVFDEKEFLKTFHSLITNENRDWWMISALENNLSADEKIIFENELLKNTGFKNEYEKYKNTVLVRSGIIFSDKDSLKRKDGRVIPLFIRYTSYAAAACLLLFLGWKWSSPEQAVGSQTNALTAVNFDMSFSPDKENYIAEEKIPDESLFEKKNNNVNTSPVNKEEIVKDNQFATNYIPIDKIRRKNNPEISVRVPEKDLVRNNIKPVDTLKENIADAVHEKNNSTVTELAFGGSDENYLTPKEYLVKQFNKKVLNKDTPENPTSEELASVASVKISDATQTPVNITTAGKEDEYKTYGFSIGKFGFNRTKKKK